MIRLGVFLFVGARLQATTVGLAILSFWCWVGRGECFAPHASRLVVRSVTCSGVTWTIFHRTFDSQVAFLSSSSLPHPPPPSSPSSSSLHSGLVPLGVLLCDGEIQRFFSGERAKSSCPLVSPLSQFDGPDTFHKFFLPPSGTPSLHLHSYSTGTRTPYSTTCFCHDSSKQGFPTA